MSNFLSKMNIRPASHSGSWYENNTTTLTIQLNDWITNSNNNNNNNNENNKKRLKAIISPHAGYRYSGSTAAYGYGKINPNIISRVFILGPSHHVYVEKMNITGANILETPVGNLNVDTTIRTSLLSTGLFEVTHPDVDCEEHSLEMQFPFIAHAMNQKNSNDGHFTVIPLMTGRLNSSTVLQYAQILLPYFLDPETLFVISSDFCHWGKRFRYTPYDPAKGDIDQYIKWLDHEAIRFIESNNLAEFTSYIQSTKNTICGQDSIKILLQLIQLSAAHSLSFDTKCLMYSQSSAAKEISDSSVSYVSLSVEENSNE